MPVYNCGPYLDAAIDSIVAQTFRDFEFVIVDDGSTDGSADVIRRRATMDSRIIPISRTNGGIADALNAGLASCVGGYVARMDGDDIAGPTRLAEQIAFLKARPDVGAVGGWAVVIDENGRPAGEITLPTEPGDVDRSLSDGNYALLHPTMTVRRDALERAGGYDPAFRYAEDLDLLLRLREVTRLANLPRKVLQYRRHKASMSGVGVSNYPAWDQKALLAANRRGRRPVAASTLARAAERVSWTALDGNDVAAAAGQAWRALRHAPWRLSGLRAFARIGRHWLRQRSRGGPDNLRTRVDATPDAHGHHNPLHHEPS